jgi:hypothetical protein
MTDIQWFPFMILPIAVFAVAWVYKVLAERAEQRQP